MKVTEILVSAKKPLFTFELLPPLKGHQLDKISHAIEMLKEYEPAYINFTYHQQEVVYVERADGLAERRVIQKRPGTVALSAAVKYKYNIEVVPHLLCGGSTAEEIENELIELNFLGIDNVFALRGDPPRGERRFVPTRYGHKYTNELVQQISTMNEGKYLDTGLKNQKKTNFCVGVAGYPEKHAEAPNMDHDIAMLKQKVEAGSDYIVTQMFFINARFFEFVDRCRAEGITVPIIPGIKPLSALSDINLIPQTFSIDLPKELYDAVAGCKKNSEVREIGVEFAIKQSKELIAYGVPGVHYYTLGRADNIAKIVKAVF
ncbi:MAG: methylenetetrahydrofolate reductase [Bacteroidetes bacterium]|nr:methylenetetrahydrofolate reductase [Bacteroidota bacterium]